MEQRDNIFEPCDFCDAPRWFGTDEHGNSEACKRCAYCVLLEKYEDGLTSTRK